MSDLSKVVWREGMALAPHHFQAQSRFFEGAVRFALAQLFFAPYGLAGVALDPEALRNGTVSLLHARGVMPDGLAFNMPEGDPLPEPRRLADAFSPTQESQRVLLAVPAYRAGAANFALDEARADPRARWVAHDVGVHDEVSGRDVQQVALGRKNFRLVLEGEAAADDVTLAVARVRRDTSGHFAYDPHFVPPCLQIGASPRLVELLRRTVALLEAKAEAVGAPAAARDVGELWLLHAVRGASPALRHLLAARRAHPERLYVELARLAGALGTFALEVDAREVPPYDHDAPEAAFDTLERLVRAALGAVAPARALRLALAPTSPGFLEAPVVDARCLAPAARWLLAVRGAAPAPELARLVPQHVKLCGARYLPELVRRALPGAALEHVPTPPAAAAPRADTQYFQLQKSGPCWDTVVATQGVGVYVPDTIAGAEVELMVVLEE